MTDLDDLVGVMTRGLVQRRDARVERELLNGRNRIVVDDEFAGIIVGRTVYEVPRWRERPLRRLRIERLRWRHRRQS